MFMVLISEEEQTTFPFLSKTWKGNYLLQCMYVCMHIGLPIRHEMQTNRILRNDCPQFMPHTFVRSYVR